MNNLLILLLLLLTPQAPTSRSILGTVTAIQKQTGEIEVKPDSSAPVPVKLGSSTIAQRIAPGQTDLKSATTINVSELAKGDRVLVTLAPNSTDVLRIVVMSASDLAKRDEADRLDWLKRGLSGIVSGKNGDQILLKLQSPRGDIQQTVTVSAKTQFKRYSADSVKFADAKASKIDEVSVGDQLRARGEKSADGMKVAAEEVVFGTFVTRGGSVVSVDAAARQITVKEIGSGKSFIVKFTPDSQVKQMPTAPPAGGPPNLAQLIDALPASKMEDIKPGSSIVVSSTKGAQPDQVTAILLVGNADLLIRAATAQGPGRGGVLTFGFGGGGAGLGGLSINP